ncbi:MAG: dihydroorotate dehydrogenase electron transfer subunit [Myxococcota bacterium]
MSPAIESKATPVRQLAQVLSNEPEGPGWTLRLAIPEWPGSIPGQFVMIAAGAEEGVTRQDPLLPRPMAVYRELTPSSDATSNEMSKSSQIELLYRVVGRGTQLLSALAPGESIKIVGPLGRGFPVEKSSALAILVGGGTGIASLYELAKSLLALGRSVLVILGAQRAADLMGSDAFAALGVELICTTDDGSAGVPGRVTGPLADRLTQIGASATVYAVGPTPMMRACAALADSQGAACFVSLENPMACGFGVCLGCAAPRREGGFSLVCRTGPVFAASELDWEGLA